MSSTQTPGPLSDTTVSVLSTLVLLTLLVVAGHTVRDTVEYAHPTLDLTRVLWQWGTLFVTTVVVFCIWYYYARKNASYKGPGTSARSPLKRDPAYCFEAPASQGPIQRFPGAHVINVMDRPERPVRNPQPEPSSAPSSSFSPPPPAPKPVWMRG